MGKSILPDDDPVMRRIGELERRIAIAEQAPRATHTDMASGLLTVTDSTGLERARFGLLDGGATYGIEVLDSNGVRALRVAGSGLEYPPAELAVRAAQAPIGISAIGTFTPTWEAAGEWVTADALKWESYLVADAATTGRARLSIYSGTMGTMHSAEANLTSAGQYVAWKWAPAPMAAYVGTSARHLVQLELVVDTGPGLVYAYPPVAAYFGGSTLIGATATGL